jgi:uracil-DNA glycosylase
MLRTIRNCSKCDLCKNQKPLLDECKNCQIFWVGLSAKTITNDNEFPLSPSTNTGRIIKIIEENINSISSYKTNLVKCVPLNEKQKLRYPYKSEIDTCFSHLVQEINELTPRVIILLGNTVTNTISQHFTVSFKPWKDFNYIYKELNGTYFIPIHHPSYIYIYKRKRINEYMDNVTHLINQLL